MMGGKYELAVGLAEAHGECKDLSGSPGVSIFSAFSASAVVFHSYQADDDKVIIPRYGDFGESPAGQPRDDCHRSQNS